MPMTAAASSLTPEAFGAVGDGVADDTSALQKACDSLSPGHTLVIAAGKVYRHRKVISLDVAGSHVTGPGSLLASAEQSSSLRINANDVTLDGGLVLQMGRTTARWTTPATARLNLTRVSGAVIRNVVVDGSASAGVLVEGASAFLIEDVIVRNSRADGIHNTGGAHHGVIRRCAVTNSGDDGFAVVSYQGDRSPCHHISFHDLRFDGNSWGRGFAVVGGHDIAFANIYGQHSDAAMMYISQEAAPWFTYPVSNISVSSATMVGSNANRSIDHGAVLVYVMENQPNDTISLSDITILETRADASRQVGLLAPSPSALTRVTLSDFTLSNGPSRLLEARWPSHYNADRWKFNDNPVAPHEGWRVPAPSDGSG
jgi:hypothetical protein